MASRTNLQRERLLATGALFLLTAAGLSWSLGPGLPVWSGPSASAAVVAEGRELFLHEWQPNDPLAKGDGLGPVFNAQSCVACHFQGGVGGAGPNSANVLTFEVAATARDPQLRQGVLHKDAVVPDCLETNEVLHRSFPIIPGGVRIVANCTVRTEDFDPVQTQVINTTALYGAGWIDRISPRAISHNQLRHVVANTAKEFTLDFNTIPPGKLRILPDGRIGKFGWKAQFATLEEFVAAACANEIGLGNPVMAQPRPLGKPSYPDIQADLDRAQFKALTAFVATLPRPVELVPEDPNQRDAAERGKQLFHGIGCAVCHTPDPGGVPGVYSDFLLHDVEDQISSSNYRQTSTVELPRPAGEPEHSAWKTPPLWGVADSAPYFHDGASPNLLAAIRRHATDASLVRDAFAALTPADQQAILTFLATLKAPPDVPSVEPQK